MLLIYHHIFNNYPVW